jgi:phosphopantetheinyl transferase
VTDTHAGSDTLDAARAPLARDEVRVFQLDSGTSDVVNDATRRILALQLGVASDDVELGIQGKGKPVLVTDPDLFFNISHSHDVSLVALTRVAPVGVDVERVRVVPHAEMILKRFFSPEQLEQILSDDHRDLRFVEAWTRAEAVVKVRGGSVWEVATPDPLVTVRNIEPPDGFAAAVALRAVEWHVTRATLTIAALRGDA